MALVLVTGDPAGGGGALVPHLVAAGHDVAFAHRAGAAAAAAEIAAKAAASGGRVFAREAAATDEAAVRGLVREAEEEAGPLAAVVACAWDPGPAADPAAPADATGIGPGTEHWAAAMEGLDGVYHACRTVIFSFVRRRGGRVVAVTPAAGLDGDPDRPLESAAASGVVGFVKSVAKEYAGYGITANVVAAPSAPADAPDTARIADTVVFLVSDAASALTGQVLRAGAGPAA
ncbi:SDR family oxidoreductase [Actinomadura fibrosa]|uniref:SDR family oxidoreductase n=1 Tax=Actinomadura fibrosa TaxID=111802 RepID=A0ABW2XUA3_9ACTN|nr:SDR family oxidoreductase [Actinomadura fibrosa]